MPILNVKVSGQKSIATPFVVMKYKTVKDRETGIRKQVEVPKRIKPWWFQSEEGKVCVAVKYGSWTIELAKGKILKKGDIVIYESTVYPGCTEEVCIPILEKNSRLRFNKDFFAGYSPERINPGDKDHRVSTIKKVH